MGTIRAKKDDVRAATSKKALCPDCGREFTARGLATHRRRKHGEQPPAPLPVSQAHEAMAGLEEVLRAMCTTLERIDDRLDRAEFAQSRGEFGKPLEPTESELERLERELAEVLGSIVSIDRLLRCGPGADPTEEGSFRKVLAMLRRRQAGILFRMGSRAGEDGRALEVF